MRRSMDSVALRPGECSVTVGAIAVNLTAVLGGWSRSFEFRDFRLLWCAVLIQSAAMGMNWVVSGWLIFEITGSPFMVGVASALGMAPFFFLGPLSGVVADRIDRRRLLSIVSLAGAASACLMAAALAAEVAELWHIMTLIAVGGAAMAFVFTTRQSLTYDIVGQRLALNGMALNSVAMQIGMVIGSLCSGMIIATIGASGQYFVISLLFLASVLFLLTIRVTRPASKPGQRESVSRNLFQYVRMMRHNRTLVALMSLAAVMELFGFTHMSLLPVLAKDVLGLGPVGLGVMTGDSPDRRGRRTARAVRSSGLPTARPAAVRNHDHIWPKSDVAGAIDQHRVLRRGADHRSRLRHVR